MDTALNSQFPRAGTMRDRNASGSKFHTYESLHSLSSTRMDSIDSRKQSFAQYLKMMSFDESYHPIGEFANILTLIVSTIGIFFAARVMFGDIADVGGTIFAILVLILLALIGGKCILVISWMIQNISKCCQAIVLPPVLGMLIVGILLKNIPYDIGQFGRGDCVNVNGSVFIDSVHDRDLAKNYSKDCFSQYIAHDLDPTIDSTLRSICLTVILLMCGLQLDPTVIWGLGGLILRASILPFAAEVLVVALLSIILLDFPVILSFVLGIIIAAASLAVIVPCLMTFSEKGYGMEKGIPTLVIATGAIQNVLSISGYGILAGIAINTGKTIWELLLHGLTEILLGSAFGLCWGYLLKWIPNKEHPHVEFFRWLLIFNGGLIAMFGSKLLYFSGAGAIAIIIMAVVAGTEWRKEDKYDSVTITFGRMWIILEPVLFALIGTELQIDKISFDKLGLVTFILIIALTTRVITNYGAVLGGNLNKKEKIFKALALIPKGTIQAALGPLFLETLSKTEDSFWMNQAQKNNLTDIDHQGVKDMWEGWGNDILTVSVVSILFTAPLGAVLITSLGPIFLETNENHYESIDENSHKDSYTSQ